MVRRSGVTQPAAMESVLEPTIVALPRRSILELAGLSWPLLLGVSGFLAVVSLGLGLSDPDVYLHVAVGRWMLLHGRVPTHDPFSFTLRGAPWVAHEWGAELVSLFVHRVAGWSGLVFLGAVCFGATLAYLMRFLLRRMEPLHALLLSALAAGMMLPYVIDRPHELVWPLTAVWVGGLVGASEENRAPSWWLLPVMLLWANMHASFILGLGLMVLLALDSVERGDNRQLSITARRWIPFCVFALACALINPQGYRLLLFPFHVIGIRELLSHFKDWRPPDLQHLTVFDLWLLVVLGAAFAGRVRLTVTRAITVIGLLFMALQSSRNVSLLGLLSPFLLAGPVAARWADASPSGGDDGRLDRLFRTLSRPARPIVVCAVLAMAGVAAAAMLRANEPRPAAVFAPRAALQAILSRVAKPRILNDPNFGDYLIYRHVPVFVDARADMYGEKFLKRTFDALSLAPDDGVQALLTQYHINAILLWPGEPIVRALDRLPGWRCVYRDKMAVAYVLRAGQAS